MQSQQKKISDILDDIMKHNYQSALAAINALESKNKKSDKAQKEKEAQVYQILKSICLGNLLEIGESQEIILDYLRHNEFTNVTE